MSDLVNDDTERIVGTARRPVEHWARAVSAERPADGIVVILHSEECLRRNLDGPRGLLACPFSEALDNGISLGRWGAHQERPVRVAVVLEELIPWHPWMACPTCTGTVRETVGMVCQTCGTDYARADQ
jgi:hypothetical protein